MAFENIIYKTPNKRILPTWKFLCYWVLTMRWIPRAPRLLKGRVESSQSKKFNVLMLRKVCHIYSYGYEPQIIPPIFGIQLLHCLRPES